MRQTLTCSFAVKSCNAYLTPQYSHIENNFEGMNPRFESRHRSPGATHAGHVRSRPPLMSSHWLHWPGFGWVRGQLSRFATSWIRSSVTTVLW